jgi:SAM-dependent methyltransferase
VAGLNHDDVVRREFTRQAPSFESSQSWFGDPRCSRWILSNLPLDPHASVLDVAGGAGHLALELAPLVRHVVVVDLTPDMLAVGRSRAEASEARNVRFEQGDAAALQYENRSFDLVVSRFAVHHFVDPGVQVREMARVCRPGGRVALVDMVAADPALADDYNRLERLRDPSHTVALPAHGLEGLLVQAGTMVVHRTSRDQRLDVEHWLAQAGTAPSPAGTIRAALERELDGGPPTGMRPSRRGGRLYFTQSWLILVAEKSV